VRIVVALGGNALLARGEVPDAQIQQEHVVQAVAALVPLATEHELVIVHGNGPQVGVLASETESDRRLTLPYPFDVLVAQTQGMIGYWLVQALQNALAGRSAGAAANATMDLSAERLVACVISQTVVDADDPAFARPTKFVGEAYPCEPEARALAAQRGWAVRPDGDGWRRVVASPNPCDVVEGPLVSRLLEGGAVVVCAGGGGIPVIREADGELRGVAAVVDKDLTAALLGEFLGADQLLVLTDVPHVMRRFGAPDQEPILEATPSVLRRLGAPAGSMGPKIEAVCRFVERTGGTAAIGLMDDAVALAAGSSGTIVRPGGIVPGSGVSGRQG